MHLYIYINYYIYIIKLLHISKHTSHRDHLVVQLFHEVFMFHEGIGEHSNILTLFTECAKTQQTHESYLYTKLKTFEFNIDRCLPNAQNVISSK